MGRLMDDILAMFGMKPSDRVKFDVSEKPREPSSSNETVQALASSDYGDQEASDSLDDEDCLACRVIGSSVCFGGSAYVWWQYRKNLHKYVGRRKLLFRIQAYSFVLVLLNLGISRAFNKGVFSGKPYLQQVADDVETFYSFIRITPPKTIQDFIERKKNEAEDKKEVS